jgi:D-alanyl-D-alanine carboxypeptidase
MVRSALCQTFDATTVNGTQYRALHEWREERGRSVKAGLSAVRGFWKILLMGTVAAGLLGLGPVNAQALDPALAKRLDGEVLRVLKEEHTPSASIAIVQGGHLTYAAAYGQARISPAIPATVHTRYQLASISKTFTAQALLLLEQHGKLRLDDPVSRWIPGLSGGDRITVRQVLEHTSGYPDHYPQTYPAGPRAQPTTPDAIIAEWGKHPLLFEPGTRFRYSNLNYVIAGRIVEKASGESLFAFLQRRVFSPLKMSATVNVDDVGAETPDIAVGYIRPALAPLQPAPNEGRGWSFGAGEVITTATDLARWDEAFLSERLLAPEQAREEVTRATLKDGSQSPYALGLFVSLRGGRKLFYHAGQGLGFLAINRIYPSEGVALVVLTSDDSSSSAFIQIADRMAYLVVPPTKTEAKARALFTAVQQNRLNRSQVSPDFNAYFDGKMARTYAESLGPLGEPDSFELVNEDETDGMTTRVYAVNVGGRRLKVVEQLLSDGRVESFDVHAGE